MAGACGWMSSTPTGSTGPEYLVGIAVRAHGLRGELVVELRTDSPDERFTPGVCLIAQRPGEPAGTLTVESARPHSGRMLVRFVEAPDRDAAEALRGTTLLVDSADIPPVDDPDEFHDHELIGLRAVTPDGADIGVVDDVLHNAQDVLVITGPSGAEVLVPFVRALVPDVDPGAGRLVVDPPPGLLDLGN